MVNMPRKTSLLVTLSPVTTTILAQSVLNFDSILLILGKTYIQCLSQIGCKPLRDSMNGYFKHHFLIQTLHISAHFSISTAKKGISINQTRQSISTRIKSSVPKFERFLITITIVMLS